MANDVTLPGTGEQIATDDIGGIQYQMMKLVDATENSTTPIGTQANPLPAALYGEAIEALEAVRCAIQALTRTIGLMQPDTAARMRVAIDSITAGLTLATITTVGTVSTVTGVTTVSTVSTLTNQTQIGGFAANDQIPALMRLGADALRRNISVS
jgi:hypothetical protein